MDRLRLAAATLNQTPLDWDGNRARLVKLLKEAQSQGVALLCFPELALSGYNCEDMFLSLHTARQAMASLLDLLPNVGSTVAAVGLPVYFKGAMYNCVAVLHQGKVLGIVPKKVLPKSGVHYEPRWFKVWSFGESSTILVNGQPVPFGDLRFQFGNVGVSIEICEEAWGLQGPSPRALAGTEVIMNPSASHFALGKYKTRETLVADASRAMQVHYIYSNMVGMENGRIVFDGGVLFGECGKIVSRGPRFGFQDGHLHVHDCDLDIVRVSKLSNQSLEREDDQKLPLTVVGAPLQKLGKSDKPLNVESHKIHYSKEEEFLFCEMLGLFDYLRKTKSRGFVVSLSGGCDSSACAVLIAHAIAEALKELGPQKLETVLGYTVKNPDDPRSWIREMLTLVYQATEFSGETTRKAASSLAEELGAAFHFVDVDPLVKSYHDRAEEIFGKQVTWEANDLSMQNIQARVRSPLVWMIANLKNAILISTSNRSEAAVGYATMDGDTSGGLAPIAGIDKHYLRSWLRWAEAECIWGLGTLKSLALVNCQAPTAELRPPDASQTDENDLMPYDVLDALERYLVRDRMSPEAILERVSAQFPQYDFSAHKVFLSRFLSLWCRNQWKRERYAPSFHIDDESLDPKTWCRFPIISSGFSKEIKELCH